MEKYILIYDIPREKKVLQVQVNRLLHKIGAEKIQHSVWESKDLDALKLIKRRIEDAGGKVLIIEKKIV